MTDLIKVNYDNDRPTVSARELHEFLEVNSKYNDWFSRMKEYGFSENIDFIAIAQKKVTAQGNESEYQDAQLTIEMGKEIAMLQRNEKGKEARQYFINLEKAWNTPEQVMARAVRIAQQQLEELKQSNNLLSNQIEQDKPKVLFADAVTASQTSILVGALAKLIKQNGHDIGQKRLFEWLRNKGYLIKQKGSDWNMPTQRSMEQGLFEIKESTHLNGDGVNITTKTTKVTGKGQQYFINLFLQNQSA